MNENELAEFFSDNFRNVFLPHRFFKKFKENKPHGITGGEFKNGNFVFFKRGKQKTEKPLLFAAHYDEVRFIVNYINEEGFLKLSTVGGISSSVIFGRVLENKRKKIRGVIGSKPKHLLKDDEKNSYPSLDEIWLDVGAKSKTEAEKIIDLAEEFFFEHAFELSGERLMATAIDDKAGCAIITKLLYEEIETDAWFALTNNEEIGCIGGGMLLENIKSMSEEEQFPFPEKCVVLEATTAADIPAVSGAEKVCEVGGGAVVSYMDCSTLYDRKFYNYIMKTADGNEIKTQTKTLIAGGNDAGAIHKSRGGITTAAISVPTRYLHSPVSICSISDIQKIYQLTKILIKDND